jgi:large subunit ribosomal protein L4
MADTTTFEVTAYTAQGTERERVPLPSETFDGTVNMPVMHQAVNMYLANQRQGTAATKIRKFVTGGNQKPWRQKGTGRARQGSTRAPHWVGGGTVFGPQPRSYNQRMNKQVKSLARKSAFNARARENAILVIDGFAYDRPKTSRMLGLLERLGVSDQKVLVLTDGVKPNVYLSGRNLPNVHVMPYADASTYHVLWSDVVLIESPAIGQSLEPIAEAEPAERPKRTKPKSKAAKRAAKAAATEETADEAPARKRGAAKKGAAKSAAKKSAGRKSAAKKSTRKAAGKKAAGRKSAAKKTTAKKKSARKGGARKKEK